MITDTQTILRERHARLRDRLVSEGRIVVLPPDEGEATELHAAERADFDAGEKR